MDQKASIIFVHGFGSSNSCWDQLISLLSKDERITSEFDFKRFEYASDWFEFNPARRIPRLQEISRSLREFIDSPEFYNRELTLVGHSQGGLVIQSYLAEILQAGEGEKLKALRQVILLATPNSGSTFFSSVRKLLSIFFFFTPQERTLRELDPVIADIRKVIIERVVGTKDRSAISWPIPIHSFIGLRDRVVKEASARTPFTAETELDADHSSIICPPNAEDRRYTEFVEALLEPSGHTNVFEVDSYDTSISAEPTIKKLEFKCKSCEKTRTVHTDNVGQMIRTVKFSPKNQCKLLFTIKYRMTCPGGCIEYFASHNNEAEAEEIGRYEDQGQEIAFKFTPQINETYWMKVDIYGGLGNGHRDICFHIGKDGYCKNRSYTLDLTRYVAAGYAITQSPRIYYYPDDPAHHHVPKQHDPKRAVESTKTEGKDIWRWEFKRVSRGFVYLIWDVSKSHD